MTRAPEVHRRLRRQSQYTVVMLGAASVNVAVGLLSTRVFLLVGSLGVFVASLALLQQALLRKRLARAERLNGRSPPD